MKKEIYRAYRLKNRERLLLESRLYWKLHREERHEYRKKWRKDNRSVHRAYSAVWNAILKGTLIRPEFCSRCGEVTKVQGHHRDYSKPLDVVWLCRGCHEIVHKEERCP